MKKNQVIDLGLTGYDELFMNDQERADIRKPKVEEIPLTELTPFKDHPFKVKNDEEMAELMKSIADSGVLAPALARSKDGGGYELISGHRRLEHGNGCKTDKTCLLRGLRGKGRRGNARQNAGGLPHAHRPAADRRLRQERRRKRLCRQ